MKVQIVLLDYQSIGIYINQYQTVLVTNHSGNQFGNRSGN